MFRIIIRPTYLKRTPLESLPRATHVLPLKIQVPLSPQPVAQKGTPLPVEYWYSLRFYNQCLVQPELTTPGLVSLKITHSRCPLFEFSIEKIAHQALILDVKWKTRSTRHFSSSISPINRHLNEKQTKISQLFHTYGRFVSPTKGGVIIV